MVEVPEVTLIIPAYNEEEVIGDTLKSVSEFVGSKFDYVLCVADDGSTDSTAEIVRRASDSDKRIYLVQLERNQGRGAVLTKALSQCKTKYAVYFDADLQIGLSVLPEVISDLRSGHDLVIGSKHHPDSKLQYSTSRFLSSVGYRTFARLLLGCTLHDFQCGLKGFNMDSTKRILPFVKHKGWSWDTEICVKAYWAGMSVKELPVEVKPNPRPSRVHFFRDVYRMGKGLLQIRADKREFLSSFKPLQDAEQGNS